ncbi:uncharacterized protein EV422DRAFT_93723, partial [Fimicolochytrium jonesii]|uniref:uncharacterized protein n=1 Tax=Fimicolochytrium jonesii TaxID=1396493 RepID=UPI0022FEF043
MHQLLLNAKTNTSFVSLSPDSCSHSSLTNVRQLAAKNVAGLTTTAEFLPFFKVNGCKPVKDLMRLVKGESIAAHDALSSLINLCVDPVFVEVMDNEDFLFDLILMIVLPRNVVADLCCMLLNNLSENNSVARKLVADISRSASETNNMPLNAPTIPTPTGQPTTTPQSQQPATKLKTHYLDNLLEVFVRGEGKTYNPNATYDFLGGVLANVAMTPAGAQWFRGRTGVDGTLRLSKVVAFVEHPNRIRRAAAIATIKNTAFDPAGHELLLTDGELDLLPYLLLPICGPEEFSDEDMEGMPDDLQLLPSTKTREPDPKLRTALVETLLLLTQTRKGRDILRAKKVYPVIRNLHAAEQDDGVQDVVERLVQMIMRDEEGEDVRDVQMPVPEAKRIKLDGEAETQAKDRKEFVIEELSDDDDDDMAIEGLV